VLETSHPPTFYLPPEDVRWEFFERVTGGAGSFCEWKGAADYYHIRVGERIAREAAWSYPDPTPAFTAIVGHVAIYAGRVDAAFVDGEPVTPQPGGFYGGWITPDVVGPFKGGPGTAGW
jgi:uncharacterized protein (DUF427 family)